MSAAGEGKAGCWMECGEVPLEVGVGVTNSLWWGVMRGAVGYKAFLERVHQIRLGVRGRLRVKEGCPR